MLQKSRAIVLSVLDYNEASVIVDLFTEAEGSVNFVVRLSKTRRAAIQRTSFEPLTQLDVEWDHREGKNFQRLRSCCPRSPYRRLPREPMKTVIAMFLGEFLQHCLRNEGRNVALYDFIERSLRWLDLSTGRIANFHIVMLFRLLDFLGLRPNMEKPEGVVCFDLLNACYLRRLPHHPYYICGEELRMIPLLARLQFQNMCLLRLSRGQRNRITEELLLYYRLHVPGFGVLRSPEVLCELV